MSIAPHPYTFCDCGMNTRLSLSEELQVLENDVPPQFLDVYAQQAVEIARTYRDEEGKPISFTSGFFTCDVTVYLYPDGGFGVDIVDYANPKNPYLVMAGKGYGMCVRSDVYRKFCTLRAFRFIQRGYPLPLINLVVPGHWRERDSRDA